MSSNPIYQPISPNSGALPAGVVVETEQQPSGAQRQVVSIGGATETNVHTGATEVRTFAAGHVCTQNSSTTPLGIGAVFTGGWQNTLDYSEVIVSVYADRASAADGLVIQWSSDGIAMSESDEFTAPAGNGKTWSFPCNRQYVRIVYTNGAIAQTVFNIQTLLKRYASKGSSHRLKDNLNQEDDAIVTKTQIVGFTTAGGGGLVNVKANPSGALTVEATVNALADGTQKTQITDPDGDVAQVIAGANTGVKGLRVYGGPTDPISDIPVYIDYDHHQNHEGEAHQYTYPLTALASGATVYFRLVVPVYNPVIYSPHMKIEIDALAQVTAALYETPTTTGNGTLQTSYNRNRNDAGVAAGMQIYLAPTVTNTGTVLSSHTVGDAAAGTSAALNFDEWILASNKIYLIGITANAAQCSVCLRLKWYEDLGV